MRSKFLPPRKLGGFLVEYINMKNNKGVASILIVLIIVGVLVLGGGTYYFLAKKTQKPIGCTLEAKVCPDGSAVGRIGPNCEFATCPTVKTDEIADWQTYRNEEYGFTLTLSQGWQGYSVTASPIEYGWKIVIRHPKWTEASPYEDIPILVYQIGQWEEWEANNFEGYPTAAPFGPSERGRNSRYVFATAPRYNYDYRTGWEDVENIIKTLKAL